jgi:PD-(D/E)XK nuclease superfamily protein
VSSHFYTPDGQLVDGLREARKVAALPSPTTILSMLKSEGLVRYLQRQAWEAAVTTPRNPGESDDDFYDRCLRWADEHSKIARERGGDFHTLIQRFHMSCIGEAAPPTCPPQFIEQFDSYMRWYEKWVAKTISVEEVVVGDGYAGRVDHVAKLKDGRIAVCDVKSQALTKRKSFNHYESHAIQLGAYAAAWQKTSGGWADALVSIYVSSNAPVTLESYVWPGAVGYYSKLFMGLLDVWCFSNNYFPTTTDRPVEAL